MLIHKWAMHLLNEGPGKPWRVALVSLAAAAALALGVANLAGPSLWHDELVHVFAGKSVADTGVPRLPGGGVYQNAIAYSYILGVFIYMAGDGEIAVRIPSVLFATANVVLLYLLIRRLLGAPTALIAVFFYALSPWSVAWSREARFYTFQATVYLGFLWCVWAALESETRARAIRWGAAAFCLLALGNLISFHSLFYLASVLAYTGCMALYARRWDSREAAVFAGALVSAGLVLCAYFLLLSPFEKSVIFGANAGLGGSQPADLRDYIQSDPWFYAKWIRTNLSSGYIFAMLVGTAAMLVRRNRRSFYAALGWWAPFLVLSFLVGYRRDRFLFFAWPFFIAVFSYGLVVIVRFLAAPKRGRFDRALAILLVLFLARLGVSAARLTGDSIHAAAGAHVTLARRHPQWRKPCSYVREHLTPDTVVLSTTALPVLYYVGRIDEWYPSRALQYETIESGLPGLPFLDDLKTYMAAHPKGFYLAEWRRFSFHARFAPEVAWVEGNMKKLDEASSADVTLYAWGGAGES